MLTGVVALQRRGQGASRRLVCLSPEVASATRLCCILGDQSNAPSALGIYVPRVVVVGVCRAAGWVRGQ